jgi:Ran GTPase-activating protein (RanGAP) involved in mRNA processing and transport
MATQSDGAWAELEETLAEEPGDLAFRAVASILDAWPGPEAGDAFAFASERLASWPDEARLAPWTWCLVAAKGETPLSMRLARAVRTSSGHDGCDAVQLPEFADQPFLCSITHVELGEYDGVTSLEPLYENPERWGALRHLFVPDWADPKAIARLLRSPLVNQLEFLGFNLIGRRQIEGEPLSVRSDRLLLLAVKSGIHDGLIGFLESSHLPSVRGLALSRNGFEASSAAAARRLAELPDFAQLTRLELIGYSPDDVLAPFFKAVSWPLEVLGIAGPNYCDYMEIGNEHWLTPAAVRALAKSSVVRTIRDLHIENGRVGDGIVKIVKTCTPGRLQRLALVDVGLTDDGAAALARLPQLTGLAHLDLRANYLGPRGIAALCESPHLAPLTTLAIGGRPFNPYYDEKHAQAIGDEGIAAIAKARPFQSIQELQIANARISPEGIAALAKSSLPARLRSLDLSMNDLGLLGAKVLARATWPSLRELCLHTCGLDDASIEELVQADLRNLRDLDLSYNSIGPKGAAALAASAGLAKLWRLNLHDNFIGDAGLTALAQSRTLTRLLEIDLEQCCANYRAAEFGDDAAREVAHSPALRRLDAFFGGNFDEYAGGRDKHPFTRAGLAAIAASASLRPAARLGLVLAKDLEDTARAFDAVREANRMSRAEAAEKIQELETAIDEYLGEPLPPGERLSDLIAAARDEPSDATLPRSTGAIAEIISPEDDDASRKNCDFRFKSREQ